MNREQIKKKLNLSEILYINEAKSPNRNPGKSRKWKQVDPISKKELIKKIEGEGDSIGRSKNGIAIVQKGKKYGHCIKKTKEIITPIIYDDVGEFYSYDRARVEKDGKEGHVDRNGKVTTPLIYDSVASEFKEGLAQVKKDGKTGCVNLNGKLVIPLQFDEIGEFYNGTAVITKELGHAYAHWQRFYGLIDKKGKVIIETNFFNECVYTRDDKIKFSRYERFNNLYVEIKFDTLTGHIVEGRNKHQRYHSIIKYIISNDWDLAK